MITRDGPLQRLEMNGFYEGVRTHKRNGIHYASYLARPKDKLGNLMHYSIAKRPLGPFEHKGAIIDNRSLNIHGSIARFRDQWYLFYHVAGPSSWERRVCMAPLTYHEDGTIVPVKIPDSK